MLANYEIPIGHYEVATGEQEEVLTVQQATEALRLAYNRKPECGHIMCIIVWEAFVGRVELAVDAAAILN